MGATFPAINRDVARGLDSGHTGAAERPRAVAFADPRLFQLMFLGALLAAGAWLRDFSIRPAQIALTFAAAITTQDLLSRAAGRRPVSWRSALITALSLTLLLRADSLWVHPLAAAVAICSKFAIRVRGKHLFNPANLGVIFALTLLPGVWVSPGQWGQDVALAGWLIALGAIVTYRARRGDISWSFLGFYLGALAVRVAWLGQSAAVWSHQLNNGALLLFAFFMISDPMTIPNDRRGRLLHALIVAAGGYLWQFWFYRFNGLLWALFFAAPLVPLWDAIWIGPKFEWNVQGGSRMFTRSKPARIAAAAALLIAVIAALSPEALAFCGFYVGKASAGLYNHASQVVYVRNGDRTVLSIMNDYQGEPSEFALVVPVPMILQKDQIHIGDRELFSHLDAYSSPRLVEYYDPDPCPPPYALMNREMAMGAGTGAPEAALGRASMAKALGVTIEAQYTVGEYDIEMLSANQSQGLETFLLQSGYHLPLGVSRALQPYIRQNMKFFVAKVNLKEHAAAGLTYLRPIQFAFESPKFMLPIRLGMVNAQGPQDLIIYMLTQNGRVETTDYRTVKVPTGMDLPEYIRGDFGDFYKAMFTQQVKQNDMRAVFTEYVWNLAAFCDPCAAPPLSSDELRQLGVFWINPGNMRRFAPAGGPAMPYEGEGPGQVIITRLHLRYSAETFPEDLMFQETQDTVDFQARYVLRHAWGGSPSACPAAKSYFDELDRRRQTDAATVADLTGWDLKEVYRRAGLDPAGASRRAAWWRQLWQ